MLEPDVYVCVDEFKKGNTFVVSVAFVPANIASQLRADWDILRKEIKSVLLSEYRHAANHLKLQMNLLPEIHAADLIHSLGYYRKYERGAEEKDDEYWLQHHTCLERALKIIQKYGVHFLPFRIPADDIRELSQIAAWMFESELGTQDGSKRYSRKKLHSLTNDAYFYAFPAALPIVDRYLLEHDLQGGIICDDHRMSKGFGVVDIFEWLRREGLYNHLTKPWFIGSVDEPLLQVSNVLCHIMGQTMYSMERDIELEQPFDKWMRAYVAGALIDSDDNYDSLVNLSMDYLALVTAEVATELCVFADEDKTRLKQVFRAHHVKGL